MKAAQMPAVLALYPHYQGRNRWDGSRCHPPHKIRRPCAMVIPPLPGPAAFTKLCSVIFSLNSILSAFVIQVRPVLVERTFRGATHCEKKKVGIDPLSAA